MEKDESIFKDDFAKVNVQLGKDIAVKSKDKCTIMVETKTRYETH